MYRGQTVAVAVVSIAYRTWTSLLLQLAGCQCTRSTTPGLAGPYSWLTIDLLRPYYGLTMALLLAYYGLTTALPPLGMALLGWQGVVGSHMGALVTALLPLWSS